MASGQKKKTDEGGNQYRCTLKTIQQVYKDVREDLTARHRELMQATPFKFLFKALDEKKLKLGKRSNEMLEDVISTYDKQEKSFKFGGKYYKPELMDVKLVFGIVDGVKETGKMKRHRRSSSALASRLFVEEKRLTARIVKDAIKRVVVEEDDTSAKDTVKLMCALLLQSVFFPNTGLYIPWGFLYYVDNLKRLRSYNWSEHVLSELFKGLNGKWSNPRNVHGCTVLLQYWICEHWDKMNEVAGDAVVAEQHSANTTGATGIPRLTKWNLKDLEDVLKENKLEDMGDNQFKEATLQPTKSEKQLIQSLSLMQRNSDAKCARVVVNNDSDFEEHVELINGKIECVERTPHQVKHNETGEKAEHTTGHGSEGKMKERVVDNEPQNDNQGKELQDGTSRVAAFKHVHHVGEWGGTPTFSLLSPTPTYVPENVIEQESMREMREDNVRLKRELEEAKSSIQLLEKEASLINNSEVVQLKKTVNELVNDNQILAITSEKLKREGLGTKRQRLVHMVSVLFFPIHSYRLRLFDVADSPLDLIRFFRGLPGCRFGVGATTVSPKELSH